MGLASSEPEPPDGDWNASSHIARKADDLRALLGALELQLANPHDVMGVADSYQRLSQWTLTHAEDEHLQDVLSRLEPEAMYPEWRRRALEDAYVLFYEDILRSGGSHALKRLPPPPISYDGQQRRPAKAVSGAFESGSRMWQLERWDYEIRETGTLAVMPSSDPAAPGSVLVSVRPQGQRDPKRRTQAMSKGREIVSKGRSARYCACASDPVCGLVVYATGYGADLDRPPALEARPLEDDASPYYPHLAFNETSVSEDSVGVVQRDPCFKRSPAGSHRSMQAKEAFPPPLADDDPFAPSAQQLHLSETRHIRR